MPDRIEEPDAGFHLVPAISDPAQARRLHAGHVAAWDEYFDAFPNLRPEEKARIPFTFTLLARRPR